MTEIETIATRLSKPQKRLLLAMTSVRPKKWRAIYRHAKVRHWTQLPFKLAQPTLTGSEVLTPLGQAVRDYLKGQPC
jgi:hypothetical protein